MRLFLIIALALVPYGLLPADDYSFEIPEEGEELDYAERMIKLSEGLKAAVFVRNASKFSGNLI